MATIKAFALPLALILALPLAGAALAGKELAPFLAFPPMPGQMPHARFSLPVFLLILGVVLITAGPLVRLGARTSPQVKPAFRKKKDTPFPCWGWAALAAFVLFWILAWTRMTWFEPFQPHTFFPLWISLILLINAVTVKRTGTCPLTVGPGRFARLFPVSALFWWTFEYLNRFVGNWVYSGSEYGALVYFFLATLSFSTVLPAVESMHALVMSFERVSGPFRDLPPLPFLNSRTTGGALMGFGALSLALIPRFPDPLFFAIWLAPLALFWGWLVLLGRSHALSSLAKGDLSPLVSYAVAALGCGFFWEMLNLYSLARWTYAIPYVQVLHVFEMPILGYAGYLPFGPACAIIIHLVDPNGTLR